MKMSFFLPVAVVALLASVTACSGGSDVYVGENPSGQMSASSSNCILAVGEDVCSNLGKFGSPRPPPETVDTLLAVIDFGAVAFDAASSMMRSCGSILDDLRIPRPQLALETEPPTAPAPRDIGRMATSYCDAASTAIGVRLQGQSPAITVTSSAPTCTTRPLASDASHACGTAAAVPRQSCAPPTVSVDVGATPSAEHLALKATLEKHLPAVYGHKARLEQLAALASKMSGSLDSLQPSCIPSLSQMAMTSVTLTSDAAAAAGKILTAMQ